MEYYITYNGITIHSGSYWLTYSAHNISGQIYYENEVSTSYANQQILLITGSQTSSMANTDSSGYYIFNNVKDGYYNINFNITCSWGGVNSTDAIVIQQYVGGTSSVLTTPLQIAAADVDANGIINSNDSLLVTQRFTGMVTEFPAGDWCYGNRIVTMSSADVVKNIPVLCFGDVNGSYENPF